MTPEPMPLHEAVAEALGDDLGPCPARLITDDIDSGREGNGWACGECGHEGAYALGANTYAHNRRANEYDTNWNATGPLIERLGIELLQHHVLGGWLAARGCRRDDLGALVGGATAHGRTQLIAVCYLILELHRSGRLPKRCINNEPEDGHAHGQDDECLR